MPQPCSICTHPNRAAIDRLIVGAAASAVANLAKAQAELVLIEEAIEYQKDAVSGAAEVLTAHTNVSSECSTPSDGERNDAGDTSPQGRARRAATEAHPVPDDAGRTTPRRPAAL